MRVTADAENLRHATATLPRRLRAIWRASRWTHAHRRRLLFDLWDECAETGPDDVLATARTVRATIVAFIHRNLPAGSPHAYPPAELAALNKNRLSHQRFDPYSPSPAH
jgi:hypothetical protein